MKQLVERLIQDETLVCPYCGSDQDIDGLWGCCGESSAHFETAYVYQNETYLESEIEIVTGPKVRHYLWLAECFIWRQVKRVKSARFKVKRFFEFQYKCNLRPKVVRFFPGFEWTKLDCLILGYFNGWAVTPPSDSK